MRQIALAQYLLRANHDVTLFASITGPDWLKNYVQSQTALAWEEVREGDFSAGYFPTGDSFDALVVDAYTLDQKALASLEERFPVVAVMIDGPWQELSGKLAIAPTLNRNPAWAAEYQERFEEFHWGPEFLMLRSEVLEARKRRAQRIPNSKPRIVVALGGSDIGGHTDAVMKVLTNSGRAAEIDVFVAGPVDQFNVNSKLVESVRFHEAGPVFLDYLANSDLAVTAAGTTAAEVSFLGVEAIFIPVVANQKENAMALRNAGFATVIDIGHDDFAGQLAEAVLKALASRGSKPDFLVLPNGVARMAKALLARAN